MRALFLIILSSFFFFSCEKDVEWELDYPPSKIVVAAIAVPGQPLYVSVYNSLNTTQAPADQVFLTDAQVFLTDENGEKEKIRLKSYTQEELFNNELYIGNFFYNYPHLFISEQKIQAGKEYFLEVEEPNYETVYSKQIIPEMVSLETAYLDVNSIRENNDQGTAKEVDVFIQFTDPANTEDFYEIYCLRTSTNTFLNGEGVMETASYDLLVDIKSDDISEANGVLSSRKSLFFTDDFFNGQTKNIKLSMLLSSRQLEPIDSSSYYTDNIYLRRLSKDYYDFLRTSTADDLLISYSSYTDNEFENNIVNDAEDFFTEAVVTANNIENGYGIFASYYIDSRLIEWRQ